MTDLFSKIKKVTEIPAISGHSSLLQVFTQQLSPHVDEKSWQMVSVGSLSQALNSLPTLLVS